jgi:hypothetical protein
MSSSRSLRSAPLPLVLLAALVAVLALLLGGSPAGAADHRRPEQALPGRAVVEARELIARGQSGQHESMRTCIWCPGTA